MALFALSFIWGKGQEVFGPTPLTHPARDRRQGVQLQGPSHSEGQVWVGVDVWALVPHDVRQLPQVRQPRAPFHIARALFQPSPQKSPT